MTATPSHPERSPQCGAWIVIALWAMVLCVAAFELAWGPAAGIRMANDDLKFVRMPSRELPMWDAIADAWRTQPSFRPLEIAMAHGSDPVTLACPWVVPVQGAALCALMLVTVGLARKALPGMRALWPLALLLVLLSPATTASVWQMDSCSQTWSAALGASGTWLAWRWIDAPERDGRPWWALAALGVVMAVGLTVKENFYGWALGLTVATVGVAVAHGRHGWASARHTLWALVPVAIVPIAHLMCRWQWSALSGLLAGSGEGTRYKAEFGMNLLVNTAVSLAGALGIGPFHLVLDGEAPAALRLLPILAAALVVAVILVAIGAAALDAKSVRGVRWSALAFMSCASVLSLSATIPMPSVSELYGLGANVGCALVVAAGIAVLWRTGDATGWSTARACVVVGAVGTGCIGSYGVVSRAYHFRVVWDTVRTLNDAIVSFQPTLVPRRVGDPSAAGMVHVPTVCLVGGTHSQYVMPPLQALDLNLTEAWLARRDPSRRIVFSIGTSPKAPRPHETVLDCAALPQHGHW
jgi:hypothetical protein